MGPLQLRWPMRRVGRRVCRTGLVCGFAVQELRAGGRAIGEKKRVRRLMRRRAVGSAGAAPGPVAVTDRQQAPTTPDRYENFTVGGARFLLR